MKKKMVYVEPAEYFTPEMRKILEAGRFGRFGAEQSGVAARDLTR